MVDTNEHDHGAVHRAVAGAVAAAVAPDDGLTEAQTSLLGAVHTALTGDLCDFGQVDHLTPGDLAEVLADHDGESRRRIVQVMVLGELILRPLPPAVARRVEDYAVALDVDDKFVRVCRRYAQGGFGLAWMDLHHSGFAEHWESARTDQLHTAALPEHQLAAADPDPELAERWRGFEHLPEGSLGRAVWDLYRGRGFGLPGSPGGASGYLAQHDFVHVIADYGTDLDGEFEVFALIGRADPDPKGFAWLATMVGLFDTGYVADAGFFSGDLTERHIDRPDMHTRVADALRRGKAARESFACDLLEVDFHERADRAVGDVRAELGIPDKSDAAVDAGSPGAFELAGMSRIQQDHARSLGQEV